MSLISIEFILFLPIVFAVYWAIPKQYVKARNLFLIIASYLFYGLIDYRFCFCLLGVSLLTWFTSNSAPNRRKLLTSLNIVACLFVLGYFKYLDFFRESFFYFFSIGDGAYTSLGLLVPAGLSFYIFMAISYSIDTNRGLIPSSTSIIDFEAYLSFFPHLLSGPVDRGRLIIPQIQKEKDFDRELANCGLRQILSGLFKKMVIADNVALVVNASWGDYSNLNTFTLLVSIILYSIQIYADFAGYSDIAIGVGKLFGIKMFQNFHFPYFSRSISEFWRNWHMSLTSWFTEYLYIPLGGNRKGKLKTIFNTLIVFTLCGLWHGSSWTFVMWGFLCGILFIPSILFPSIKNRWKNKPNSLSFQSVLAMLIVFVLISISWVFFRAPSVDDAFGYLYSIFSNFSIPFTLVGFTMSHWVMWVGLLILFVIIEWFERNTEFSLFSLINYHKAVRWAVYLFIILIIFYYKTTTGEFIYQNF